MSDGWSRMINAASGTTTSSATTATGRLAMDRTTLARDLRPLQRRGLVAVSVGADRRVRMAELTDEGHRLVDEVRPLWKTVQRDVRAQLGPRPRRPAHGRAAGGDCN
jgi:DNA-binding MarR family transcriptional regulator